MTIISSKVIEELRRFHVVTKYIVYPKQSSDIKEYQVKLSNVPSVSKEDVLVVHNGKIIPHWVETKGTVWTKVPTLFSRVPIIIYTLTGNPSPTKNSNGFNTFVFFDDFEDGNYTGRWTVTSGTWTEALGYLRDVGVANSRIIASFSPSLSNFVFEFKVWIEGTTDFQPGISTPNNGYVFHISSGAAWFLGYKDTSTRAATPTWFGTPNPSPTTGVWHDAKLTKVGSTVQWFYDGVSQGTGTDASFMTSASQVVLLGNSVNSRFERYDDIRVRKIANPEPSVIKIKTLNKSLLLESLWRR